MEQAILLFNRVLPILLLLLLGNQLRRHAFLSPATIEELRKLVVNLALPAVLFTSFVAIELKIAYLALFLLTFVLCMGLFFLGRYLKQKLQIEYTYFPCLITGFEYGMLGISLFGGAYGLDAIGYIAVADLGHEIFIWFVFLPILLVMRDGASRPGDIFKGFIGAPVVLAILAGLVCNVLGLGDRLQVLPLTGAIMTTFSMLGSLTVPLILLVVGYGIRFTPYGLKDALLVVMIRLGFLVPLAFIVNSVLIRRLLSLDPMYEAAMFTLMILPPPFIIPLYASQDLAEKERQYLNNVLTLHTLVSTLLFILYFVFTQT